jgi:hypothetical protein
VNGTLPQPGYVTPADTDGKGNSRLPSGDFEALIESGKPPTVTALADGSAAGQAA